MCALSSSRPYGILALVNFDNASVIFDNGRFDEWCVYITDGTDRFAPHDSWYFQELIDWTSHRPAEAIYNDFVRIYELTTKDISEEVLHLIFDLSAQYADIAKARIVFKTLYYGMIAEENKKNALGAELPLKKRIKRLGVYMVLMEDKSAEFAARYSRGLGADYLDKVCYYRGF